jgi:hypothetical protein
MGEYRHKATGEVKTQGEWRSANPNISMPRTWNQNVLDALNIEAVFETPKPDVGPYQNAARNGVTQDANGNWVQAWAVVDMFSDYTDEEGVLHTKAEQEAAYQAGLDAEVAKGIRAERNRLLSESDWTQVLDAPVDQDAWATYRQALRDITSQEGFPHSVVWPTKPQ